VPHSNDLNAALAWKAELERKDEELIGKNKGGFSRPPRMPHSSQDRAGDASESPTADELEYNTAIANNRLSEKSPGISRTRTNLTTSKLPVGRDPTPEELRQHELVGEIQKQEAHLRQLRREERILTPRLMELREQEQQLECALQKEAELTPRVHALEVEKQKLESDLEQRRRESTLLVAASAIIAVGMMGMSFVMRQKQT